MKAHYEILQHSEEWHKCRYRKIGGTLSKGLFVKSDTLLIDILSEYLEPFQLEDDSFQSPDMVRGTELEPHARLALSNYLGIELFECGWLQSEENELLGISPDGIDETETITAEIKCFARKMHTETILYDDIPNKNIHQCLHYFTVNPKLKKHYFCSFRPENTIKPLFVKEITRDSQINLGTKANPKVKSVDEWVAIAHREATLLLTEIQQSIEKLSF